MRKKIECLENSDAKILVRRVLMLFHAFLKKKKLYLHLVFKCNFSIHPIVVPPKPQGEELKDNC